MIQLKKRKKAAGQSTLEYLLLFAAVGTVLIFLLMDGGPFRETVEDAFTVEMDELSETAENYSDYLKSAAQD